MYFIVDRDVNSIETDDYDDKYSLVSMLRLFFKERGNISSGLSSNNLE